MMDVPWDRDEGLDWWLIKGCQWFGWFTGR